MQRIKIILESRDTLLDILDKIGAQVSMLASDSSVAAEKRLFIEIRDNDVLHHLTALKILHNRFPGIVFCLITRHRDFRRIGESIGIKYALRDSALDFQEAHARTHVLRHNYSF
jgi:hypothetical protein